MYSKSSSASSVINALTAWVFSLATRSNCFGLHSGPAWRAHRLECLCACEWCGYFQGNQRALGASQSADWNLKCKVAPKWKVGTRQPLIWKVRLPVKVASQGLVTSSASRMSVYELCLPTHWRGLHGTSPCFLIVRSTLVRSTLTWCASIISGRREGKGTVRLNWLFIQ